MLGDNGLSELLSGEAGGSSASLVDVGKNAPDDDIMRLKGTSSLLNSKKLTPASSTQVSSGDGASSIAGMLQAQRDRYKERLSQAEIEVQSQRHTIQHLSNEKSQLESDNVTLYQKIRFLQSSSGNGNRGSDPFATKLADVVGSHQELTASSFRDRERATNLKYRELYEEKISPFSQVRSLKFYVDIIVFLLTTCCLKFSQLEKQRKLKELTVAERIVLNTTIAMVSSPTGRR